MGVLITARVARVLVDDEPGLRCPSKDTASESDASDGEEEAPLPPEPNTNPTSIVDISVVRAAAAAGVVVLVSCAITYPSGHNPAGVIVSLGIFERAFVKYANKLDKLGMWLLCWQYTPSWAYVVLLYILMPVAPSSGLRQ